MKGPLLVGLAAFLWATDALFRFPSIQSVNPVFMVFVEHLLAVVALLPWIVASRRRELFALSRPQWIGIALVGMGGSALATILFTMSFRLINPSIAILLQKIQPVLVVLIAYAALGERPARNFYPWAAIALAASLLLSFPDLDFGFASDESGQDRLKGILCTLGAAAIWAASTVIGRGLLLKLDVGVISFWRFFFGLVALAAMIPFAWDGSFQLALGSGQLAVSLLYISLVSGLLAMVVYYAGLSRTPASVTTFMELIFPIAAVALNAVVLKLPLGTVQIGAGAVLLMAVWRIAVGREK
ncbi:MAG TPA: DMT family transporter [Bdellovibrionota bacterium]|nr:DMT family transporter [Bdellovibrionota bacterium]